MRIKESKISNFWKGELGIQAAVEDGAKEYKVDLFIKGSQVFDYSCSCVNGNSYKGMCEHEKFVFAQWEKEHIAKSGKAVNTAQEIRTMIREYTNRDVAEIIRENEGSQIRLLPRLILKNGESYLEFRVGKDRMYMVKDLIAFVQAIESGALVTYGKNMAFHHSVQAFVEEDRPLCMLLLELISDYRNHYKQFQKSSYVTMQALRQLHLGAVGIDRFFDLMDGKTLEVERTSGNREEVQVVKSRLKLPLLIQKGGRDGIRLTVDKEIYGFSGESHWYVAYKEKLHCLDRDASEELGVFFQQVLKDKKSHVLEIQDRDIPLFTERVLPKLLPYSELKVEDVDLDSYRPQELKAQFTFDSAGSGVLTMEPILSYGDYSFRPTEDERVPRIICRDVPGEFRINQTIKRYFSNDQIEGSLFSIRNDEDQMYRLLKDGIPEFMGLGEVLITEEAKKIQILPSPEVHIGVRTNGSWLDLQVEADGMTPAQLQKILSEYDAKKPYYRLKSGEFLQLDENGFVTVARMMEQLSIGKSQLVDGQVRIPAYRAFYLDSVLKEGSGITFYRDNLFRAVVRGMKSVEDSEYQVPEQLQSVLRGYQKTGFRWLKTLDEHRFGGILADDMGLGKTIQIISLLLDAFQHEDMMKTLIVCPASLVYNWENEFHSFAPQLQVKTIIGTASEREEAIKAAGDKDILITSYDLLKRDINLYENMNFRYEILDEAQYIKNPITLSAKAVKMISATTKFALTGTPIENRLSELWSIFDFLMPGFLFSYGTFKKKYESPIVKDGDRAKLEDLHRLIGPFILRRLKKDVLKELPDKLETVVYAKAEDEQKELILAHTLQLKQQLENSDGNLGSEKLEILAQLTRMRQLCCHPVLCYPKYRGESAKLDTCMELITSGVRGGHKILLFSQFTSMLELIEKRLQKEEIPYYKLTGSTSKEERVHLTGAFQKDAVPVFLISLKAGGTGLNLTAADMVIHYDPWWNVAAQNQATDRAHRIGQDKEVSVFKLIMKGTIEENILKLQESKESLAGQIISEGTVSLSSMTKDDLLSLLS